MEVRFDFNILMMRHFFIVVVLFVSYAGNAQLTSLYCFAPKYVGESVHLYRFQDLITYTEEEIASGTVGKDSSFTLNFYFHELAKLKLQVGKNYGFLYAQPNGKYELYFPEKPAYDAQKELGSEVELSFRNLDSTDINYKILSYDNWEYKFLGDYSYLKASDGVKFSQKLDTFKLNLQTYYFKDTSQYMRNFVKYRIAQLDEMSFTAQRNEAERFDHYLKNASVYYQNEPYINYVCRFFADYIERASPQLNNAYYNAILHSSPTLLFNAMREDYRMKNLRLREFILINSLGEIYYNDDYPQTNIHTMLDSLSKHTLFSANKIVAQNINNKLSNLVPGSPCPHYSLDSLNGQKWSGVAGKYTYFQLVELGTTLAQNEMMLLTTLHEKYQSDIQFVTVFVNSKQKIKNASTMQASYPWALTVPHDEYGFKQQFKVNALPYYILVDPDGLIVQIPALRPSPNGEYQTIEKTFYEIHRAMAQKMR